MKIGVSGSNITDINYVIKKLKKHGYDASTEYEKFLIYIQDNTWFNLGGLFVLCLMSYLLISLVLTFKFYFSNPDFKPLVNSNE